MAAVGLVAVLVLSIAASVACLSALAWVDHTLEVRNTIDEWRTRVRAADTLGAHFVETKDPELRERFTSALSRQSDTAQQLRAIVGDNPRQVANVDAAIHNANLLLGG